MEQETIDKAIKELKVFFAVLAIIAGAIASFLMWLICAFAGWPLLFAFAPLFISFIIAELIHFKKGKKHILLFVTVGLTSALGLYIGGYAYYKAVYIPRITVKESYNGNISHYKVFSADSLVATLDSPSTLTLNENELPRVDGATALFPVYASFVNATFPNKIPPCNEEGGAFFYGNTIGAYDKLIQGERDIIFCAAPSEDQLKEAREAGVELKLTPIGKEGFVFFVNKKNPVNSLTTEELRAIYSGTITNWNQIGGKNKKIKAYQRKKDSGSQSQLIRFMGNVPLATPPKEEIVDGMGGIIEMTQNYRNAKGAIGFSFRFFVQDMYESKGIKLLSVNGIEPTVENISSGAYPITGNFYAVTTQHSKNTEKFLEWILGEQGQELIVKTGYATLNSDASVKAE